MSLSLGIDVGSTTAKVVLLEGEEIIFSKYERHYSKVREKSIEILKDLREKIGDKRFSVAISGSAGFGISKITNIDFVQEVFATAEAVKKLIPDTDAVIELGGEDAKIIFLSGGLEERMNGSCAGGTGSFIDQMITLLNVTPEEFDDLSLNHSKIYPVASRCGVFAKTDVQPLLNQGIKKEDISASIFQAVVEQTISGLAQGRKIEGKILFLGGPLFYYKGLQERFKETLKLSDENAVFPDFAQFAVAIGVAFYSSNSNVDYSCDELIDIFENAKNTTSRNKYLEPLFSSQADLEAFESRHNQATTNEIDIKDFVGDAYLGIDCGSTTTKLVLIDKNGGIIYKYYGSNLGNPVQVILDELKKIYILCGNRIKIRGSGVTGYGEELIKSAFKIDIGLVETMAHLNAARFFNPKVDFIIDIGGQDMKCFYIKNNSIDSIMLNEACSSGCGSFIETFAKSMGYDVESFAKLGLDSKHPVELGSRCTVFMNSSVKEAQKEGACIEDISAGLSMSVVKNALYKVIRAKDADDLGKNIVVQGGTFLNNAILRSFEKELNRNVIRPKIAGLMGAYGVALFARECKESSIITQAELEGFRHISAPSICNICGNKCQLTINRFEGGRKLISGNRCDRPLGIKKKTIFLPNIYDYKLNKIKNLTIKLQHDEELKTFKGKVGIPLGLNIYENIVFWHELFSKLGYEVVLSDISTRKTYAIGQYSIPSDTVCYPAKLLHGHIENLLSKGVDTIFYPCMAYSFDDGGQSTTNYNCPVVAFYPELLNRNIDKLKNVRFLYPYFGLHRSEDFIKKAYPFFKKEFKADKKSFKLAVQSAYEKRQIQIDDILNQGTKALEFAMQNNLKCIILAGRPYHIDPEINHGIDKLINSLGVVVLSEDSISAEIGKLDILNQWSYHARLYSAANFAKKYDNVELVQLVSFGCGIDSITTDEVRRILENGDKFYTQIKIDEINNLGAVKIRIRSLLSAMEVKQKEAMESRESAESAGNPESAKIAESESLDSTDSMKSAESSHEKAKELELNY
ncbi:2-hydroxyglutaryl-CoA dehydratase [Helicobacter sp. 16-1353]|uniref:acyl-CoA dehydratase activase n=1 Tax=Helicobacter sp. 16-1353 TaxID=2004996 RepID=UPI000DCED723|nr:acyl-CoA dehydratase activase [Helicobacter sp. 16-1353]RAX54432.1 2-hydroxyglutaryl-CoA dehydratase [Helicobacter sp. 16-1353]